MKKCICTSEEIKPGDRVISCFTCSGIRLAWNHNITTLGKDGKWCPATPEPYHPNWLEKLMCWMGIHHDNLKDSGICYICDKKINQ